MRSEKQSEKNEEAGQERGQKREGGRSDGNCRPSKAFAECFGLHHDQKSVADEATF